MSQNYLVIGAVAAFLIFIIQKYFLLKRPFWKQHGIKTVIVVNPIVRMLKGISVNDNNEIIYNQIGDSKIAGYQETGYNVVLLKDLDLFKRICIKDFDYFVNRRGFRLRDKNWNQMVSSMVDKEWKDLRNTMSPTFSSGKIRGMFPILKESSDAFGKYVKKLVEATNSREIDIEDAMGRYLTNVVTSVGFGIDCEIFKNEKSYVASLANKMVLKFTTKNFFQMVIFSKLPKWMTKFQPLLIDKEANEFFTKVLSDTIKHREKSGERRIDFIQLMLDAKHGQLTQDEEDAKMDAFEKDAQLQDKNRKQMEITDELIVANCMLFFFGGLDTTKSAVVFAAYALAINPHIQEKLRNELEKVMEDNNGELTYDICNQHEYLDKFINETLRMYPPAPGNERLCSKDYMIPETKQFIPKGSVVGFPILQVHYDEEHFPNPEVFDPERFSPEIKSKRHPYAFQPFGHGPRNCIASRFALVQSKAVIANLVLNFDIEPSEKTIIPMKFNNTGQLRAGEKLHLKLTPRKS